MQYYNSNNPSNMQSHLEAGWLFLYTYISITSRHCEVRSNLYAMQGE
ncbi:MAG: hypothetical protein JWR38_2193 [Mucilaginibacter sp.]|nr:hypothetical protein [Mucilaginibacter sp.]